MESPFQVEVLPTWQHVAPRWLRLQGQGFGTPFQQANWLATWYGVFGELPGIEPVLVAVSDRRSGDDIMRWSTVLGSPEDLWERSSSLADELLLP
jgi:CelD/BcsL family acetyltransferase involved in cellulose biosynthesis